MTVDSFDATGRVNLVARRSRIWRSTRAIIDGTYANREGHLTQLSIAGPDINVTAQGDIALNETGASNLTAHLESPALERIGEIIGQPLKGAAVVDATVTGNARELKAEGTLQGSNIGYGDNEALSLKSTLRRGCSGSDAGERRRSRRRAPPRSSKSAGQKMRELTADTTYSQSKLEFNAVAQEGVRQLAAEGSAVFHPDHQEIHLGDAGAARRADRVAHRARHGGRDSLRRQPDWRSRTCSSSAAISASRRTARSARRAKRCTCAPATSTSRSSIDCCSAISGSRDG